ncbi:MAG: beta-ketoacyl-ACP synthase II [Bacteroidales bacterium]|nr:beta-ketoacyl-ACP synthase II [Bacteroidales bacterium]
MELQRVVITGMGALTPVGNNVDDYWDALLKGVSGAGPITHFDPEKFETRFACEVKGLTVEDFIPKKTIARMDLCAQYAMISTMEALEDSGLDLERINKDRVGVIIGSGIGGFTSMMDSAISFIASDRVPRFSPYLLIKVLGDVISGHISLKYGFSGPNYITSAACASAANAIGDAMHLIQLGKADIIVTGGTEASINETAIGGFNAMHALSTRNDDYMHASRPFDSKRDGFVMGEGAATLILERLDHALARGAKIYGEICGIGMTADTYHITAPAPDGKSAAASMRLALQDAGMKPEEVDYINMHGTSTPQGDISECIAIQNTFGDHARKLLLNSTKSMTGHLLGAGPAVESVAILKSIQNNIAHPTINIEKLDERIPQDWNFCAQGPVQHPIDVVMSNSFGFGGHNVSLLYKRYVE